jgi:hypothetical protein
MARGGSAIIRNNIKHFEEEKYVTRAIQATIVTVKTSKQNLTVSAIYCPPRYRIYANEYKILAYFPGVARVFIYPNLIVICVPSFSDNFYAPWRYITHSSADLRTVTYSH